MTTTASPDASASSSPSSNLDGPHGGGPDGGDVDVLAGARGVLRFWWIIVATVVLSVGITTVRAGSTETRHQATAVVYMGQPVGPNGQVLGTVGSRAVTAIEDARGDEALRAAADAAGVPASRIRNGLTVVAVQSPLASKLQSPPALLKVTVRDSDPKIATAAATAIGTHLVDGANTYADQKLAALEQRSAAARESLELIDAERATALAQVKQGGSDAATWALLASSLAREGALARQDLADAEGAEALTTEFEMARVEQAPKASKVAVADGSSSVMVSVLLGLLVGTGLAWLASRIWPRRAG